MSHCVHEKEAFLVHAVTSQHTSKACANPTDTAKAAVHSAVTYLQ